MTSPPSASSDRPDHRPRRPGIVRVRALVELDRDHELVDRLRAAGQRSLHHEPHEATAARRREELSVVEDPFQLLGCSEPAGRDRALTTVSCSSASDPRKLPGRVVTSRKPSVNRCYASIHTEPRPPVSTCRTTVSLRNAFAASAATSPFTEVGVLVPNRGVRLPASISRDEVRSTHRPSPRRGLDRFCPRRLLSSHRPYWPFRGEAPP